MTIPENSSQHFLAEWTVFAIFKIDFLFEIHCFNCIFDFVV